MSSFDYNNASTQGFDVIPDGTIVVAQMNIRPGGTGEDGLLKLSKDGACEMLDCELTIVEGEHTKRKFWELMVLSGTTDGQKQAADISRNKLRKILECTRGIKPEDASEAAKAARVAELGDFDGLRFMCKLGVEPATEKFKAKNILLDVITPDNKAWHAIEQQPKTAKAKKGTDNAPVPIEKPNWAKKAS
jgi:hypothetical protein